MLPLLPALILLLLHGPSMGDRALAHLGDEVQLTTLRLLAGTSNEQKVLSQLLEVSPTSALLHILRQRARSVNSAPAVTPVVSNFDGLDTIHSNLWMKSAVHGRDGPFEA